MVSFGLRQIQEIFAFDVARTHVVADGVADDFSARIHHQRQFRLRHVPFGVAPDADGFAGADDFLRQRFEENFRPFRRINLVVGGGAEIGFLHARGFAAQISHARRPDFLPLDRREQLDFGQRDARQVLFGELLELRDGIFAFQQLETIL